MCPLSRSEPQFAVLEALGERVKKEMPMAFQKIGETSDRVGEIELRSLPDLKQRIEKVRLYLL